MSNTNNVERKPHVCPPSNATHPSDRWESLFVYSFICKFTNLRHKVEGLESPMDLEEALMSVEPNPILTQILVQFITNLKPQTRNLSADLISSTVASVLAEYCKTSERTVFWDEDLHANVDPFQGLDGGFFTTDWRVKLQILRQLVELQLTHAPNIKEIIERAWGVVHNKHKKGSTNHPPPDPSGSQTQEQLQLIPIGQDCQRKRFWATDDSPRLYVSTNPWKITATFQAVSTTKDEYLAIIENLKQVAPPEPKKGQKRTKLELGHIALIATLEGRLESIDAELARVQRVRRKIDQKRALLAQAELRQTRTRRQTQKPDYVYNNDFDDEDDGGDDYRYQEEANEEDEYDQGSLNGDKRGRAAAMGTRRSTRQTATGGNGTRSRSTDSLLWRGERRSSRRATIQEDEPAPKRARLGTEESTVSGQSHEDSTREGSGSVAGVRVKPTGAAALKPGEMALEALPGKKKSKFWVYAVEPVANPEPTANGNGNGTHLNGYDSQNTPEAESRSEGTEDVLMN